MRGKRIGQLPAVVAVVFLAIAAFVAAATVVQAVRQDSWGPIWMVGWLPSVVVVSLWGTTSGRACRPRLRGLTRR